MQIRVLSQKNIVAVLLALFLVTAESIAQKSPTVVLDTIAEVAQVDLNPHLIIVEDPSNSLEIVDLTQTLMAAATSDLKPLDKLDGTKTYWGILEIENRIPYPTEWVLEPGGQDRVEFFIQDPYGNLSSQVTGRMVPRSQRANLLGNPLVNKFQFSLEEPGNYRLFVRMENEYKMQLVFDAQLYRLNTWEKMTLRSEVQRQALFAFTAGFFTIMFFYNLLLYFFSGDRVYLHYSGYIFFPLLYFMNTNGIFVNSILGEWPDGYLYTRSLSPCIAMIFYMYFMRAFLDTKELLGEKWDRIVDYVVWIQVFNLFMCIVLIAIGTPERAFRLASVLLHLISFIVVIWMFVLLLRTKNKLAQYFTIGASMFILSACFFAFVVATKVFPFEIGQLGQIIGIAGELITFSLGLGYRIRMIERERALVQEENAKILAEQNQTLENRVKQRTMEIEKQKEEILTQNEELHQQQEEIIAQRDYIGEQKKSLEEQHKRMTDSIRYAKTIQQAILPLEGYFDSAFREYFIMYRPKDIVSGDFYWMAQADNATYLAVVDCTGHGVPGAFMSIVGSTILDDIIGKEKIYDPAEMLEHLNQSVQFLLKQHDRSDNQDGMDVCLCRFERMASIGKEDDYSDVRVTFAGAKRPLYYREAEELELDQLKGTRKSIGGVQRGDKKFANQNFILPAGSVVYLTTDGLVDQHNSKGRKIGSPRFERKLQNIAHLPMSEQRQKLDKMLDKYQGDQNQRDDITIVGVRL